MKKLDTRKQKEQKKRNRKIRGIIAAAGTVGLVVLVCFIVIFVRGKMSVRNKEYDQQITQLNESIQTQKERTDALEAKKKYINSKEYVEDVAKNKLGLIYPDEIVFRAEDS